MNTDIVNADSVARLNMRWQINAQFALFNNYTWHTGRKVEPDYDMKHLFSYKLHRLIYSVMGVSLAGK